jgi:2,3-bisphosphoglycerate-dependent phosphoglycerate mutase
MSDLYCAATIVVARHGEAEYETEQLSDAGGSLTLRGRAQARALAESLRDRKVAAIWCSDMARAVQTAEIAASVLGVAVTVRAGLREFAAGGLAGQPIDYDLAAVWDPWMTGDLSGGCPGAETGEDVVRRFRDELESIADLYRGETVLVISHGAAICLGLAQLADNVPADYPVGRPLAHCTPSELTVDADGWVLKSWDGRAV